MTEEPGSVWSSIRRAAVTSIVTAVVGALISWAGGWLPELWEGAKASAGWSWHLLTLRVPVPIAILAILVLPWLIRGTRAVRRSLEHKQELGVHSKASPDQQLSEL